MSSAVNRAEVALIGLPGSGKKRVKQAIQDQLGYESVVVSQPSAECGAQQSVWCVVDARAAFDVEQDAAALNYLATLLMLADGVVLSFVEAADLSLQTQWSQWIKLQRPLPIVRLTYGRFPQGWSGFETQDKPYYQPQSIVLPDLSFEQWGMQAAYRFAVNKIYLDHLLMGLDALRRNLGVRIWRVQGVFYTFEYVNLVQIEGTPFGVETFAATNEVADGWLQIQGIDLPEAQLRELVHACQLSF